MTAYIDAMRHYADFSGRATRSQFWLYMLIYAIILVIALVIDKMLKIDPTGEVQVVASVVWLAHIIPSLAISVRRLHDINRSGWWVLFGIVPVIGWIVMLVFACTPSQPSITGMPIAYPEKNQPGMHPSSSSPGAPLDQLEKLSALRASGVLSDEEFARMKAQLLQQVRG